MIDFGPKYNLKKKVFSNFLEKYTMFFKRYLTNLLEIPALDLNDLSIRWNVGTHPVKFEHMKLPIFDVTQNVWDINF